MKIGVFGGTFNPIHYGHLANAQIILEDLSLDKIIFIPAKIPVHKELASEISPEHRYNMVKRAIAQNKQFSVSRMEIDRDKPSYSILTVQELQEQYPKSKIYFIAGEDSYDTIHLWKDYKKLLANVFLVVMRRPGSKNKLNKNIGNHDAIIFAENRNIDISSTYIRERVKKNKRITYLTPGTVIDYIQDKGLYKN